MGIGGDTNSLRMPLDASKHSDTWTRSCSADSRDDLVRL